MTSFNHALPPLLELELNRTLHRYRRLRLLRATLKFFILTLPLVAIVGLACWWWPAHAMALGALLVPITVCLGSWAFWPLFAHPISLRDVASYIDRQHPDLQDRVLSAVVLAERGENVASAWMLENFLTEAQQRVKGIPLDDFMRPWEFRVLAGAVLLCGAACVVGGLGAAWKFGILRNTGGAEGRLAAVGFEVKPGNAEIQPGDNLIVWVTASDTASAKYIYWQQGGGEQRAILQPSTTPEVSYYTFSALQEDVHYQVRVGGEASEYFEIRVKRPPGVESIEARYVYPEYLGISPTSVPFSGEISGVEGTRVTLRVEANKPLESLKMVRDGAGEMALAPVGEALWEGSFDLVTPDTYHLALLDREGQENPDPEIYKITVTPDNPPVIRVKFPRGDAKVLALEEVPFAFEVEDDFGIDGYGIQYSLAGKEPVRLALSKSGETLQEVTAEYLMALEEMGLSDGDLITWSIWATDRKPGRADYETAGDPYFLEVRPYTLRYREQVSQGGGGGGAQAGGDAALDQKKIIIALTNLRKSAKGMKEDDFNGHKEKIVDSQVQLRDQLSEGLLKASPEEQKLGGEAVQAMEDVLNSLGSAALPAPEVALGEGVESAKRAWQAMLKLEPELREVARQEGGGGGGGGGAGQQELDALEMGQRKGYVEEASTGAEASKENEAIRKGLDDLARRQELLNEDLGKLISEAEQAKAAEEKKRQLERLQEEQRRQMERLDQLRNQVASSEMDGAQRQAAGNTLDQARESMERSLESAREEELQEARASGSRAAQNLSDAESALEQLTRDGARDRFAALEQEVKALGERQASVQKQTSALKEEQAAPGVEGHDAWAERMEALKAEKQALAAETKETLEGAGGLSDQLRPNQELLSRKLGDWVRRTSKTGVVEDMEEGLPLVEYGVWDAAERQEAQVKRKIDEAAKNLESLRGFLPGASEDSMERALEMLTSLDEKKGEAPGTGEAGEQSADAAAPGDAGQGTAGQPGEGQQSAGEGQGQGNAQTAQADSASEGPGGNSGGGAGSGPDEVPSMGGFFDGEAREWRPVLRDAASLLPQESNLRQSLEQVEIDLGRFQREYDQSKELPDVLEFEQVVRRPLTDTIATLETLVRAKATGEATWLEDEGAIPEQYVDRVAEYFRLLAEKPAKP